jgi:hypothetical protein
MTISDKPRSVRACPAADIEHVERPRRQVPAHDLLRTQKLELPETLENRRVQLVEEPREPGEVGGVEGGDAGPELEAGAVQAVRVARRDDHVGSLLARAPSSLEPDAGAAADHQDRLAGQLQFAVRGVHRDSTPASCGPPAICARSACSASTKISEKVGNGWIVSRSTSSGTPARTASVACCSHSPASGPSA